MVKAEIAYDGQIEITGDVGDRVVPGMRDGKIPLSWAACNMVRGVFGDDLEVGTQLLAWAVEEQERRVKRAMRLREANDGPAFEITTEVERDDDNEAKLQDVEAQWWYEIWRGMPEYINRDTKSWHQIWVHFRGPGDMEKFSELIGQTVTRASRAVWYPEAKQFNFSEWRWVDEDQKTEDLPETARIPSMKQGPNSKKRHQPGWENRQKNNLPFETRKRKKVR